MDIRERILLLVQAQGTKKAAADVGDVTKAVEKLDDKTEKTGRSMRTAATESKFLQRNVREMSNTMRFGVVAATGLAIAVGKSAVSEYREAQKVVRQTNAALAATNNVANVSANGLNRLSGALSIKSGLDDDAIQSAGNLLLGFRAIHNEVGRGNDIFDQGLRTAVDMAAFYKTDLRAAALQLGKALNDPVKGATALGRMGAIDKSAVETIKEMAKQGADLLTLQKFVLDEVNKAGVAGAAGSQADPIDQTNRAFLEMKEVLGGGLWPIVRAVSLGLTTFFVALQEGRPWAVAIVAVLGGLTAGMIALSIAMLAATVAAAPIAATALLIVAGLAALAVALVFAYNRVGWFRNAVDLLWKVLGYTTPIGFAIQHLDGLVSFVTGMPRKIASAAKGLWGGLKVGLIETINWVIGKVNWLIRKFNGSLGRVPGVPNVAEIGMIDVPQLADGGVVTGAGSWITGESGPELNTSDGSGRVTVQPLSRADPVSLGSAGGSRGRELVQTIILKVGERELARTVRRAALDDLLAQSPAG